MKAMESVRDDKRYGRSKEVRTPELIVPIKKFMDKDRRVTIETINAQFDVSVGTVHSIIRKELKMRKICVKFAPVVLRKHQKERRRYAWGSVWNWWMNLPKLSRALSDISWVIIIKGFLHE